MIYDNSIETIPASYNSYDLNTSPHKVLSVDYANTPKYIVSKHQIIRSDGEIVTNTNFGERTIVIEGRTTGSSKSDLESKLDTLKSKFIGYEKNLDIYVAGATRRYVATVSATSFEIFQGCICKWIITFTCSALGRDTSTTSLTFGTYTASNTSYANTFGGSYKTQPYIDFTVTKAFPYWSNKFIQFKNAALNERIRITKDWNFGDRVIIDGFNKTVSIYKTSKTVIDKLDSITGWTSGHTLSLNTTTMVEGTGCANIVMGSASTNTYADKLNFTPWLDLSSTMGTIYVPVFIPTPTSGSVTGCQIIIGSDTTLGTNYWLKNVTTQYDGSAIATNAWNYFAFDLSTGGANTGTPVRTTIKSMSIRLYSGSNFQLNGWRVDYISLMKPSVVPEAQDYEGTFINMEPGSGNITVEDELDTRSITITGNYYKRYI